MDEINEINSTSEETVSKTDEVISEEPASEKNSTEKAEETKKPSLKKEALPELELIVRMSIQKSISGKTETVTQKFSPTAKGKALTTLKDFIFNSMRGQWAGNKSRFGLSPKSLWFQTDIVISDNTPKYIIHEITETITDTILFSDGTFTNGKPFLSSALKPWFVDMMSFWENPVYNFCMPEADTDGLPQSAISASAHAEAILAANRSNYNLETSSPAVDAFISRYRTQMLQESGQAAPPPSVSRYAEPDEPEEEELNEEEEQPIPDASEFDEEPSYSDESDSDYEEDYGEEPDFTNSEYMDPPDDDELPI